VPAWGRTRIGLRCSEGPTRWNVFLPVTIQVWAPAMVLATPLPAGARLTDSQLLRAEVDWGSAALPVFVQAEALVGRTLARAMPAGQALHGGDLQARQWFAMGETVRIVASGDGFSITAEGQALSAGLEGQAARVRTDSGRVLVGRAVGERRVEVGL
jgi:flagella basal body P-ring formation protein FlgA